jgi:predicted GH43/DUF377 family glycosyl hydrolase
VRQWEKKGLIYAPSGDLWWARKYAIFPTAELTAPNIIRVYFTSLDENNFGRVGYVDLDANDLSHVLYETKEPILDIGEIGTFDDSGVSAFSVLSWQGRKCLFYQGWQRCERTPYMIMSGVAASTDGSSFQKVSRVPLLDRTDLEPFMRATPFVIEHQGVLKMWYVSCLDWVKRETDLHYRIVIRHASSGDGVTWATHEHICVEPNFEDEYAVGRPWVIYENGVYKMWYSIRSFTDLYVIGYAESQDGIHWLRMDREAGIAKSAEGWDSEMICYPCVIDVKGRRHLFYNGNHHGATGFGYAVLED